MAAVLELDEVIHHMVVNADKADPVVSPMEQGQTIILS